MVDYELMPIGIGLSDALPTPAFGRICLVRFSFKAKRYNENERKIKTAVRHA